jgi:hypothetical protein
VWTTRRELGRDHAQTGLGERLVWTGTDGSTATLNLEDLDRNQAGEHHKTPVRGSPSRESLTRALDSAVSVFVGMVGGRRRVAIDGGGERGCHPGPVLTGRVGVNAEHDGWVGVTAAFRDHTNGYACGQEQGGVQATQIAQPSGTQRFRRARQLVAGNPPGAGDDRLVALPQ